MLGGLVGGVAFVAWTIVGYSLIALFRLFVLNITEPSARLPWVYVGMSYTFWIFFGYVLGRKIADSKILNVFLASLIPLIALTCAQALGPDRPIHLSLERFIHNDIWPFLAAFGAWLTRARRF